MIFQHTWQVVIEGRKTQDRRICKPNQAYDEFDKCVYRLTFTLPTPNHMTGQKRILWQVGRTYAVQPGRGKKSIGRILLIGIRQEHVQDISEVDAEAEGAGRIPRNEWVVPYTYREAYEALWRSIHAEPGTRWEDNPLVWVLEFELVKNG